MKKAIALIIAAALAAAALAGCSKAPAAGAGIDSLLASAAAGLNKNCPAAIDAETRMDNVTTPGNKTLQFNYTLVNYAMADLPPDKIAVIKTVMQETLLNTIQSNIQGGGDMKPLAAAGATFAYDYRSSDGQEVFTLTYTPDDYNTAASAAAGYDSPVPAS